MFWVLRARLAPPARARRLLRHLTDPAQFWRAVPLASTPADDARFAPAGDYWLGSVWAPTHYVVIRGLLRCGENALAERLARQYYWCVAEIHARTGTFCENSAPGGPSRPDFCGWTAIAPIALQREFIGPQARRQAEVA
jgi:neutral trehalase